MFWIWLPTGSAEGLQVRGKVAGAHLVPLRPDPQGIAENEPTDGR